MEHIKDILKQWWKSFVKNHIIDEIPPNEPFLKDDIIIKEEDIMKDIQSRNDNFEDDYDNQPFGD